MSDGPNVFHYQKNWIPYTPNQYSGEMHRVTFNFNILKHIGLGAKLIFAPYGVDYGLDILCFNINGLIYWGGSNV